LPELSILPPGWSSMTPRLVTLPPFIANVIAFPTANLVLSRISSESVAFSVRFFIKTQKVGGLPQVPPKLAHTVATFGLAASST
jgi:hypothetical protein